MSRSADAPSIVWPIFALVIVSVIVAAMVLFAVTFNGPPPREMAGGVAKAAQMLRSGASPSRDGPSPTFRMMPTAPTGPEGFHVDGAAAAQLAAALDVPRRDVLVFTLRPQDEPGGGFGRDFVLGWRTAAGWRVLESPRPLLGAWHVRTLAAMLIAIIALAVPAWALARAISRPLAAVARAAEQAHAGASLPPLPQGGAREVRALSRSVAGMHARLAAYAEGRTTMLAAIAHDMGTPLSRLAFRIEALPEAARERALGDIAEMRGMIAAALSFARDENSDVTARLDLGSLIESLVDDLADVGTPIVAMPGPRTVIRGDADSLRRLFANLIENGVRYGGGGEIGWQRVDDTVIVRIDDRGPGIAPDMLERVFEPFVRGDPSRNRATGGTGLGLAIARSIATRHGGQVTLENRAVGARATVILPIA
ncbi:MAG: HAMP domain-containing histidine kinase [Sphingomonas sp.]|nr:MAG: HAMP domain-containing histidine kinase [Sphingomonas sp.]